MRIIGVVAFFLILLVIAYAYLAFAPTQYGELKKTVGAAQQRVETKLAPRIEVPGGATEKPSEPPMISYEPLRAMPATVTLHRANFVEEVGLYDSYDHLLLAVRPQINAAERDWSIDLFMPRIFLSPGRYSTWFLPEYKPAQGQSLWAKLGLTKTFNMKRLTGEISGQQRINYRLTMPTEGDIEGLHRYLDSFEAFLLRPQWDIPKLDRINEPPHGWTFERVALLAIARASLRGDQARALELLDRYLEAIRIMHVLARGGWESFQADSISLVFVGFAELPDFPEEGWERARKGLEAMRLSEAELDDLRRVRMNLFHDRMVGALVNGHSLIPRGNTWHYLGDGKLESGLNTLLAPIAVRQTKQLALGMGRGDSINTLHLNTSQLHQTMHFMNYDLNSNSDLIEVAWQDLRSIAELNRQIDRALLVLAAAHARRDGKPTQSMISGSGLQLEVVELPIYTYFDLNDQEIVAESGNPGMQIGHAWTQYYLAHSGENPSTPEDVEEIIKIGGGKTEWRKYIKTLQPDPVYMVWGMGKVPLAGIWDCDPADARNGNWIDAIETRFIVSKDSLLTEGMKKILMRKKTDANKGPRE